LRHPGVTTAYSLKAVIPELAAVDPTTLSRIDIDGQPKNISLFENIFLNDYSYIGQYDMHMSRQEADVRAFMEDDSFLLDPRLDYSSVFGLSSEVVEKLNLVRPTTIVSFCYLLPPPIKLC
jgi:tRNA uridine 5-carboxymethylaminomethyl modification enzyme